MWVSSFNTSDIDVHHGDGVQEAFYHTNRVCTLSFHQYDPDGNFFPGTGSLEEVGEKEGRFCTINVPLRQGCQDNKFFHLFKTIFDQTIEAYQPEAIWMQCGADSLRGDTIGGFNLSISGHSKAISHVLSKRLPTVFNGGGGYNVENVARCWAYESLVITNQFPDELTIPENSKYKYEYTSTDLLFQPENKHMITNDYNTDDYTQKILAKVFSGIKKLDNSLPFLELERIDGMNRLIDKRYDIERDEPETEKNTYLKKRKDSQF